MESYLVKLVLSQPLRDPAIRQAIRALDLSTGSRGLDAGCGIGSHTLLLAKVVGIGGHVIGLDLSSELVAYAQGLAEQSDHSGQVSFQNGNVNELSFDDGIRRALISLLGMLWGEMQAKMAQTDREEYHRLTDPKSPDYILDSPDYYAYFTYSMFEGRVAGNEGK